MPTSLKGDKGRTAHHIQDVAHHFLGGVNESPRPARHHSSVPLDRPGDLHFALAATSVELSAQLVEELTRASLSVGSGVSSTSRVMCARPGVNWTNLGAASQERLAALETTAAWCGAAGCPRRGRDGLIWCLPVDQATSWWSAYKLGRLVAALSPAQIKIVLLAEEADSTELEATVRSAGVPTSREVKPDDLHEVLKQQCRDVHVTSALPGSPEILILPDPGRDNARSAVLHGIVQGLILATQSG